MAAMTLADATEHVITTDDRFALTEADIRGVRLPVFANTPANLRELMWRGEAHRGENPDLPGEYLIYLEERGTFDDFCATVRRSSAVLTDKLGIRPGDRVAIAMRNYPEYLTLMMAIANIGAVVVMVNAWWTTDELTYGFDDSAAKLVFADGPRAARIAPFAAEKNIRIIGVRDASGDEHLNDLLEGVADPGWSDAPIAPDDDFAVMYSSGSTGHPKGIVMTHRGAITAVYSWLCTGLVAPLMAPEGLAPPPPGPPVILCATPLFHVTASHPMFLLSIPLGAKLVLMHKWDAAEALRLIEVEKVTRFVGVPTMSADLKEVAARTGQTAPTIEYLGSGGAKRPAAQVGEQASVFPERAVATGWGMTETNALGLGLAGPDYVARPESAGRLVPPLQKLRIVDDAGQPVPNGVVGEISVKSAANMRCYLNKPEATADALRDGWLHTGDLGMVDDDGYVTIVDRKKNIIIRGGENISCLEVEGAIHRHPAVAEACAFSVPDERLGEIVGAGIQLRPGAALADADLSAFLSDQLALFKIPAAVWWWDAPLPRGATDKIDRRALRQLCLNGQKQQN